MSPTDEATLHTLLAAPELLGAAHTAPVELLARVASALLPLVDRPTLKSALDAALPWLDQLAALQVEARSAALSRGLRTGDSGAARLIGALLIIGGPLLRAALPRTSRTVLLERLTAALRDGPAPLPSLAPGLRSALGDPPHAGWTDLRAILAAPPAILATIEAADESLIGRSSQQLAPTPGPIRSTIRASGGSTITDSSITIGGAPAPAAPPVPSRQEPARLEIVVYGTDAQLTVEARLTRAESGATVASSMARPAIATLDLAALHAVSLDPLAYGRRLTADLLADPALRTLVSTALRLAQATSTPLRLQVRLAASAAALHALRWETLCDPETGTALALSQQVWLARTLESNDWSPVVQRRRHALRALAIIASPDNLSDYQLAPLDVDREISLARATLGVRATLLAGADATLPTISAALRDGYDMLYLVCHGRVIDGETHLWLHAEPGAAAVTPGSALVQRVRELHQRPLVAVLMACESAGRGDTDATISLGPQLITAGIPAVIAAQGALTMETAATFGPTLFRSLRRHGQVDQAVAEARAAVRARDDWWVPALLTSLADGRLWR